MRVGSLFSGIGGFDEGFIRAGMGLSWQCEADQHCLSVLRHHYPNTKILKDVSNVTAPIEPVELLCGGFPCQDLSVAGRRAGLAGERSGLFHEFMRIAAECSPSPRWIVIENVPGLLSSNRGRDMATVLGALEELGYGWAYRCLDSQFFGVPQRRRRIFIVGHFGDWRPAAKVLFERESVSGDSSPGRKKRAGTTQAITSRFGGGGPDDNRAQGGFYIPMKSTSLTVRHGKQSPDSDATQTLLVFDSTQITHPANRSQVKPGNPCHSLPSEGHAPTVAFTIHGTDKTARAASYTDLAGSLRTRPPGSQENSSTTAVQSGMQVRRLTPKECERLQGFPDDWTRWGRTKDGEIKEIADGPRYKMLGNAVTVPVAEWIGCRIMEAENGRK